MSQSENVTVELIELQQLNDPHVPQSLSTESSNGVGVVTRTQANGVRRTAGELEKTKTSTVSSNGVEVVTQTQANGDCNVRRTGGELETTKTSIFNRCQHVDTVLLAVVILVVLKLLLLPIVFYHLPLAPRNGTMVNQNNTSGVPSPGNCSNQIAQTDSMCSSNAVYTQDACQDYLLTLQGCLPNRQGSSAVYVSVTDQVETEGQVNLLLNSLNTLISPSPECRAAVEPFLCLYLFGLCDSSGVAYGPSSEECVFISTDVCASEWSQANSLLIQFGMSPLPECTSFPSTATGISGSGSGRQSETNVQSQPSASVPEPVNCSTLQCQEGFSCSAVGNASVCLPVCGIWEEYSRSTVVAIDVVVIISAVIGFVSSIAVLVISCIRWNRMFTFPSVFVVYMTITLMVVAILVLITYTDRTSLYCSSKHLVDAETRRLIGPTPFCTLAGITFYYGLFQLAVWWFCHEISLFWKIKFPFHARSFETSHRTKYVHITMVAVGLVLPALPVIVTFTTGDPSGFGLTRFPPILCTGLQRDSTFYSLVLPINILVAIGIPLLIIIFWIIHKQHGLIKTKHSKQLFKIGTAERKILIIFCYYVLLVTIALTAFTVTTRNIGQFAAAVADYWRCELTGVDPENPCDGLIAPFRDRTNPVLTSFSYILLGLFPAVNLVFAVNISELKQKFKTCSSRLGKFYSSEEKSTSSAVASGSSTQP